jgi:hypothetical protein
MDLPEAAIHGESSLVPSALLRDAIQVFDVERQDTCRAEVGALRRHSVLPAEASHLA